MSQKLKGLIAAGLYQGQTIEEALFEMRDGLWIRTAQGVQLDLLGRVYRESRQGREDEEYRTAIAVRAASVVNGTPDEIITFLKLAFGFTAPIYTPEYPAAFWIEPPADLTVSQLERFSPAGVAAFPAEYMVTVEGEYVTTIEGEKMMVPRTTASSFLGDSLETIYDVFNDTLGTGETLTDTLEF